MWRNSFIGLWSIIKVFEFRVGTTWLIVLAENALIALIPLLIGLSIDGLLAVRQDELILMVKVLFGLPLRQIEPWERHWSE